MSERRLLLGISGGIAACKAPILIRELGRRNIEVKTVPTENAKKFVTEAALRSLTGHPVYDRMFVSQTEPFEHIALADWGGVMLVAPATANCIGKFARGIADDLLSTLYISFNKPVAVAPSMNENMLLHPAVKRNLDILRNDGVVIFEPERGSLACGVEGLGRMMEPERIVEEILPLFDSIEKLKGKKALVSASATREFIDPVRFISNPSSGKMGFAIAAELARHGAEVTLVTGPTAQVAPSSMKTIPVTSAEEMFKAVTGMASKMDIVIMAAAVADYKPATRAKDKIRKSDNALSSLELERTRDILARLGGKKPRNQTLVGFAAETSGHLANAVDKLRRKKLDAIVLNDVAGQAAGFAADDNAATVIFPASKKKAASLPGVKRATSGGTKIAMKEFSLMSKRLLARKIVEMIAEL